MGEGSHEIDVLFVFSDSLLCACLPAYLSFCLRLSVSLRLLLLFAGAIDLSRSLACCSHPLSSSPGGANRVRPHGAGPERHAHQGFRRSVLQAEEGGRRDAAASGTAGAWATRRTLSPVPGRPNKKLLYHVYVFIFSDESNCVNSQKKNVFYCLFVESRHPFHGSEEAWNLFFVGKQKPPRVPNPPHPAKRRGEGRVTNVFCLGDALLARRFFFYGLAQRSKQYVLRVSQSHFTLLVRSLPSEVLLHTKV